MQATKLKRFLRTYWQIKQRCYLVFCKGQGFSMDLSLVGPHYFSNHCQLMYAATDVEINS